MWAENIPAGETFAETRAWVAGFLTAYFHCRPYLVAAGEVEELTEHQRRLLTARKT